jgi:hypothetical protein
MLGSGGDPNLARQPKLPALDERIVLAILLRRICPQSSFMAKLTRKIPSSLQYFIGIAKKFMNAEDTIKAFTEPSSKENKENMSPMLTYGRPRGALDKRRSIGSIHSND